MAFLSQAPPLGGLLPPHGAFQEHAAHPPEWSEELSSKGSSGTCIPDGVFHIPLPCFHGAHSGSGISSPDQDSAVLVYSHLFGEDHVVFEVCKQLVIELQPALEHPIGYALLLLEEGKHLGQDGIIVHAHASMCASVASVCGSQKIMSIVWYSTMAAESAVRASCR